MSVVATLALTEEQRQLVLLALARLAVEKPGFRDALTEIAAPIDTPTPDGPKTFMSFVKLHDSGERLMVEIAPTMAPEGRRRWAQPDELLEAGWWKQNDDPNLPGVDPVPPELLNTRVRWSGTDWMVPWDPPIPPAPTPPPHAPGAGGA